MVIIAGPSRTMNMLGKMNKTSGKTSFTVVLAAISSASCRRFMRIPSEKVVSALEIGVRQHAGEALDDIQLGALSHAAPRLDAALSRPLLQVDLGKLFRNGRMTQGEFLSRAQQRLVQP